MTDAITVIRVVDCETTGLEGEDPPPRLCEVAYVDLWKRDDDNSGVWQRGRMWDTLINPGVPIRPEVSAVHHITDSMVKDAPPLDAIKGELSAVGDQGVAPSYYAAHNAGFEVAMMPWLMGDPTKVLCTYKGAVNVWPDAPNFKNQTLRYWLGIKLEHPSVAVPHRAPGDAYVTAAILRRMLHIKRSDDSRLSLSQLAEISSMPVILPKLFFGKHALTPCDQLPADYWEWILKNITDKPDVTHTANFYLANARAARRSRSPVSPSTEPTY